MRYSHSVSISLFSVARDKKINKFQKRQKTHFKHVTRNMIFDKTIR